MEEITLEKIDIIRERTGVSYREAKEALEKSNGNVLEALIDFDDNKKDSKWTEEFSVRSGEVIDKVKGLIYEGNVNKISVKSEGRTLVEIPVTFGAIGAMVLPHLAVLGVLVAMFKRCTIEVVRNDGSKVETEVEENDTPREKDWNDHRKDGGIQFLPLTIKDNFVMILTKIRQCGKKTPNDQEKCQRAKESVSLATRQVDGLPKLREEPLLMSLSAGQ